jgi:hypothetical protein
MVRRFDRAARVAVIAALLSLSACAGRVDIATGVASEENGVPGEAAAQEAESTSRPRPGSAEDPPKKKSDGQAIVLATGGRFLGLALSASDVYWADAALGAVRKVSKNGGSPIAIATGQASPSGIALGAGVVAWTNTGDGTVRKASTTGSSTGVGVMTLASGQASPRSVTIAGGEAYFTTDESLMKVPLSGGAAITLAPKNGDVPLGQGGVQGITSDGGLVFAAPFQIVWPVDGNCGKPSTFGLCTAAWYAGPNMRGGAVAGDSLFVAWSPVPTAGEILAGKTNVSLASAQVNPEAIAVDETHVYWVNAGTELNGFHDGSVMKVPRSGGAPTAIAVNQLRPVAIAVDASFVFWNNEGSGGAGATLMRAPK